MIIDGILCNYLKWWLWRLSRKGQKTIYARWSYSNKNMHIKGDWEGKCQVVITLHRYCRLNNSTPYLLLPPRDAQVPLKLMDVTLVGKSNFAGVSKLRIVGWGDYPMLLGWAQHNHKRSLKRKSEESAASEKKMWQQKQRLEWCGNKSRKMGIL